MVTLARPALKLESDPRVRRVGCSIMWMAVFVGLFFMGLWLMVAAFAFRYNAIWSLIIVLSACAFSAFLMFTAYSLVRDSKRRYVLELTDSEAVLDVFDGASGKKATQMVLLDDITWAEYYPYRDSASIIFHTAYADMEVPLWPMGWRHKDILDFLEGRGVRVIDVQLDQPIPD